MGEAYTRGLSRQVAAVRPISNLDCAVVRRTASHKRGREPVLRAAYGGTSYANRKQPIS